MSFDQSLDVTGAEGRGRRPVRRQFDRFDGQPPLITVSSQRVERTTAAFCAGYVKGLIDATTNFYNVHYIYQRIFGDDMGFVALRDLGFNPYGNSIIANGAWLKANPELAKKFVSVTQRAYATCAKDSKPCIETLAKAGSQKVEDVTNNWRLVVELMTHKTSTEKALGFFDPGRMDDDYDAVKTSFDIEAYDVKSAYTNEFLDMSIKMPTATN